MSQTPRDPTAAVSPSTFPAAPLPDAGAGGVAPWGLLWQSQAALLT